jgi:hypothetical protein
MPVEGLPLSVDDPQLGIGNDYPRQNQGVTVKPPAC